MHSESWALGGEESDRMNPSTSILTLGAEQNSLRVRAIEPRLGYRGSLMHPGRVSGASQGFFCPAYKSMRRLRALAMPPSVGIIGKQEMCQRRRDLCESRNYLLHSYLRRFAYKYISTPFNPHMLKDGGNIR